MSMLAAIRGPQALARLNVLDKNAEIQYKNAMKLLVRTFSIACVCLLINSACQPKPKGRGQPSTTGGEQKTSVANAIDEAKKGVEAYLESEDAKKAHVSLKTVDFTFKVTDTVGAGVDLNILVFKGGVSGTQQRVRQVGYHYGKPSQLFALKIGPPKSSEFTEAIRRAVSQKLPPNIGSVPVSEINIEQDFGVELKASAGVQIPVATITVGPNVNFDRNDVQQVKIVFTVNPSGSSASKVKQNAFLASAPGN